jgi:hypothetical protein
MQGDHFGSKTASRCRGQSQIQGSLSVLIVRLRLTIPRRHLALEVSVASDRSDILLMDIQRATRRGLRFGFILIVHLASPFRWPNGPHRIGFRSDAEKRRHEELSL